MRLKHTLEASRLDEANMIDNLVGLIEKQLQSAESEYTKVLRKLTISLSTIKNTLKKDERFQRDIAPELKKAILDKIVRDGDYPQEMVDIVVHFFGE